VATPTEASVGTSVAVFLVLDWVVFFVLIFGDASLSRENRIRIKTGGFQSSSLQIVNHWLSQVKAPGELECRQH
jgi:hypothetical protein